jgi:hypothetical protein
MFAPAARARYDVGKRFSITGTFRLLYPETLYTYTPAPNFAGSPRREEESRLSPSLDFGAQGWF